MIITAGIFIFLGMLVFHFWVRSSNKLLIKDLHDLPESSYALVLGAGLETDGKPTDILSDRVLSAVKLIKSGKAELLIMSGASDGAEYDEVAAMEQLAIKAGIDREEILIDKAGISTLDSLINFKNRFHNENLIIVTQDFHLPRSIWLAKKLRLNCYGYPANIYHFSAFKKFVWSAREFFAQPFNLLKFFVYSISGKNQPI